MKYQIIYADPPWTYNNPKGNNPSMGGITYPTMSIDQIKDLPVNEISDKNCCLFLWATMPKLPQALEVIDAWRFKHITTAFTWIKTNPKSAGIYSGLGHWTNGNAELVLLGKKGKPKRITKNIKQVVMAPRSCHSAKPDEVRDRIVRLLGDIPRIELFARERVNGWDAIGNQIDGRDIRDVLMEWNVEIKKTG